LVEALVGLARFDDAERVVNRLEARGRALDRPRARATAARGRGIVCAARKKTDAALEAFADALGFHEQFTAPFERARTLLVLGMTQRRAKQLRAARDTLESATAIFDDLGASLFASRAREELASLAGRRPANGLTPTEERVARLAAEGLTNREVAEALVVSVSAVEAHLTRIYAKLGVRSRTQLARRFAA
jgi:DNA-binding CsgD family transcriptional regulator